MKTFKTFQTFCRYFCAVKFKIMTLSADIKKLERRFVPKDFVVTTWESLEPFFRDLAERPIDSKAALEQWMRDMSEV